MKYKLKKWWEKNKDFVFLPAYLLLVAVLGFLAWLAFARPKPKTASADYSAPPSQSYPIDGINCVVLPEEVEFEYSGASFTDGVAFLTLTADLSVPVWLHSGTPDDGFSYSCPLPVLYYEDLGNILTVTYQSYVYYSAVDFNVDYDMCGIQQEDFAYYTYGVTFIIEYFPIGGGYEMGYESGYTAGKSDGLIQGREEVRQQEQEKFENALEYEKSLSYEEGYQKGKDDTKAGYSKDELEQIRAEIEAEMIADKDTFLDGIFTIFDAPVKIIRQSLNFELFGVNVANLVFFALTCSLVIFVIKMYKGG